VVAGEVVVDTDSFGFVLDLFVVRDTLQSMMAFLPQPHSSPVAAAAADDDADVDAEAIKSWLADKERAGLAGVGGDDERGGQNFVLFRDQAEPDHFRAGESQPAESPIDRLEFRQHIPQLRGGRGRGVRGPALPARRAQPFSFVFRATTFSPLSSRFLPPPATTATATRTTTGTTSPTTRPLIAL